jgi:hypothetical protein
MSLRSLRIPGKRLGLGTFVNSDIDSKRRIVLFGNSVWTAANASRLFTQAVTRMATVKAVLTSYSVFDALGSGSFVFGNSTLTNGTVYIRCKPKTDAANTANNAGAIHYWIVGTPDLNIC